MYKFKYWLSALFILSTLTLSAQEEPCLAPTEQIDQGFNRLTNEAVNNVRARLKTAGDVWWDNNDGKYIVPQVAPGETEVSSIFAGAVWLGGFDQGNNLKIACQQYGSASGQTDFFSGPLSDSTGTTNKSICENWDRFFEVYASEIDEHLNNLALAEQGVLDYTEDMIPFGVKYWPAKGNPYFAQQYGFQLPDADQGLAFYYDDLDSDFDVYDPLNGDYPIIEVRGCNDPQYPDQMIFWIYNDAGGIHAETNGDQIKMEVQVQAFSYGTNDQINDMTFQKYKLINRADGDIDSTYFAMWVDADLGCYTDDFIGCDTSRSLMYTYNADAEDGTTGTTCEGGVPTYGTEIPIVGVDYFRGPLKPIFNDDGNIIAEEELGMSSFTYYNNGGFNDPPPGTTDPNTPEEFYNYLSGTWRDGNPFTFGDDGYLDGDEIKYAFTEAPNNPDGWSMCTAGLAEYDRRTVQASGPFRLKPGAINELIIGVVWVPELAYPCPDINRLFKADDLAQGLFDNCFDILDGPDAPNVDLVELDQEVVLILSNDELLSNNAFEKYEEVDPTAPNIEGVDSTYNFEGYIVYQLQSSNDLSLVDLQDPEKARIVAKYDIANGVKSIYNWSFETISRPDGTSEDIFFPELMVEGTDNGIQHTLSINRDFFASGLDLSLKNHKKYYLH